MAKAEEKREIAPESLKEKAIRLIKEQYEVAADNKAHSYLVPGGEMEAATDAGAMQDFAVALGIITELEATELEESYWHRRDKIATNIPDRFGD